MSKKFISLEEYENRVGSKRRNAYAAFIVLLISALLVFTYGDLHHSGWPLIALAVLGNLVLLFAWHPYMKEVKQIASELAPEDDKK